MVFNYAIRAISVLIAKLLTWLLAPVMALRFYRQEEYKVTGYPSQFPGKLREHIDWPFQWASTFDDCADAMFYSGRMPGVTQAQYDASKWIRYKARVLWLWRNPAYTFARDLGYDQTGIETITVVDQSELLDKGHPNKTYRKFTNAYGQRGFLYERQIHLGYQWFFEMVLGYKAPWKNDRKNRAMVAVRFTIKRYPKQEV